jgi:hypothetical protein
MAMTRLGKFTVALLLTLSMGCVRSLHPLYTAQDVTFRSELVGCWSPVDAKDTWEFSKQGENAFRLICTDAKGKAGVFDAHLATIGDQLFLDLFPRKPQQKQNDFYQIHLLPVHTFVHITQIEPTLLMRFPNPGWLKKYIAVNPSAIRHEKIDGEIILTAAPKEMQVFWLKHLEEKDAFGEASEMTRQHPPISPEPGVGGTQKRKDQ